MQTKLCPTPYGRIAYNDAANGGYPTIFMHGLPTGKALFDPLRPLLDSHLRPITFDLNDYGGSDKLEQITSKTIGTTITHQQRADALDALRQHLNLDRFILVAHDLGSSVAIDYMGKYGAYVHSLVLMSPPVYPDFVEPTIVKIVRLPYVGETLVKIARNQLLHNSIKRGLVHHKRYTTELQLAFATPFNGRSGQAALLRNLRWGRPHTFFKDYPTIIRQLTTPTLVIHGRQDPYIPLAHAQRLHQDLIHSQLRIIDDGAHFLPIDTPQQVAQAINQFTMETLKVAASN